MPESRDGQLGLFDGRIALVNYEGNLLRELGSLEIFAVAVRGERVLATGERILVPSSISCPEIYFERVPAQIVLNISLSPDPTRKEKPLEVALCARHPDGEFPLAADSMSLRDHFVADSCWYPLDPGQVDHVRKLVADGELVLGPADLADYVKLISQRQIPVRINFSLDELLARIKLDSLPPSSFSGSLFEYQKTGLSWLMLFDQAGIGCILADEMGLGKTVQLIALIVSRSRSAPVLIVAPATILENWRRELSRFSPGVVALVHQGPNRTGFPRDLATRDVVIVSYGTLVSDSVLFRTVTWDLVILDEAQNVKNPLAVRTRTVRALQGRRTVVVTGTPVENRLLDIWSLIAIVFPNLLGPMEDFEDRYAQDLNSLERLVSPLILRRTLISVGLELPEKIDIPLGLVMSHHEASGYRRLRDRFMGQSRDKLWAALTYLRMFCTHPFLIEGSIPGVDPTSVSVKYQRLVEIVEEIRAAGDKCLLFTSFQGMVDLAVNDLASRLGVDTLGMDGRTPVPERQGIIDRFSKTGGPAVLIANPATGGTGLNITAANHIIHYNPEWNPAKEDQATARAYRIGQSAPVVVHRLYYLGTVEEVIENRLERKRGLAGAIVPVTESPEEEFRDLLAALQASPLEQWPERE